MTPVQIYMKAYREKHRERLREQNRKWRQENGAWRRAYEKKYWAAHPEARKRKVKAAYLKNRVLRTAQIKAYKESRREHFKKVQRAYDSLPERRVKRAACTKRWLKAHPEFIKARNVKRKALMRGASSGTRGANEMIQRWKRLKNFTCYYCQEKFPVKQLHIDHVLAISRGGEHIEENLCAACATCNLRKHAHSVTELTFVPQRLLAL